MNGPLLWEVGCVLSVVGVLMALFGLLAWDGATLGGRHYLNDKHSRDMAACAVTGMVFLAVGLPMAALL